MLLFTNSVHMFIDLPWFLRALGGKRYSTPLQEQASLILFESFAGMISMSQLTILKVFGIL